MIGEHAAARASRSSRASRRRCRASSLRPTRCRGTPHARMFASRSQSDVIRAISQPTGRWSKNENDSRCRFSNAVAADVVAHVRADLAAGPDEAADRHASSTACTRGRRPRTATGSHRRPCAATASTTALRDQRKRHVHRRGAASRRTRASRARVDTVARSAKRLPPQTEAHPPRERFLVEAVVVVVVVVHRFLSATRRSSTRMSSRDLGVERSPWI